MPQLVGLLAAVALVVAVLGLVLAARRSGDDESAAVTTVPASSAPAPTSEVMQPAPVSTVAPAPTATLASTTVVAAPIPATTIPATEPPPTPTTRAPEPPTTQPATTEPTATQPVTTEPATTQPAPTQPATTVPTSAPVAAGANVLDDPLPSGVRSAEVQPSLVMVQRLADALATGDWDTARSLSRSLRNLSDAQLEDGYGGLDRSTVLLVDARRRQGGDDLVVALIANERAGAQTTIYCIQSTVNAAGDVSQNAASVLDRYSGTLGLEDVREDVATTDLIRRQCALSS